MSPAEIPRLAALWDDLTQRALSPEEIPWEEISLALAETRAVTDSYRQAKRIPKSLCRLLLNMDEFLSFAALMEKKEKGDGFYHCCDALSQAKEIKESFFQEPTA